MGEIVYDNRRFTYEIIRRKRKTIGIKITQEGKVIVACPNYIDEAYIKGVMYKKAEWIFSKQDLIKARNHPVGPSELKDGSLINYLGRSYKLHVFSRKGSDLVEIIFEDGIFKAYTGDISDENVKNECIRKAFINWFKIKAAERFSERTGYFAQILNLYPAKITVKDQKTLWGSCSCKANINYNYRLVMAPCEVLDYVVIHELCHLACHNHSKNFWSLVEKVMPEYKEKRDWLKKNGESLIV